MMKKNCEDIFIPFDMIHERDGHTDGQTPHDEIGRAYTLHRAANWRKTPIFDQERCALLTRKCKHWREEVHRIFLMPRHKSQPLFNHLLAFM